MALLPATMAEALWIGYAEGKNHANIGIGQGTTGGGGNHIDYDQSVIEAGFTDPSHFFLNASGNPVFKINASAGTTSTNTIHPRSELRELLAGSEEKAAWDGRTGKHLMKGQSRIIELTDNRPWICFFQAHGSTGSPNSSDLFRVQTEGTNGTTTNLSIVCRRTPPSGGGEIRTVLRTGYNLNDWVTWETWIGGDNSSDNSRLRIWLDSVLVLDVSSMGQILSYWKTGCYLQDSVGEGAGSSTNGAVEMLKGSLQIWHTGYPAPTTPIFTGADDGLGAGTDVTPPTVPANLAAIRGDTTALLVWEASTDDVGVDHYVVYRSSVEDAGSVTTTANLGKSDDGSGSSTSSANKTVVSTFVAGTTGTVTAGHARLWVDTGTASIKMCVYSVDGAGEANALLGLSDALSVTGTTEADRTFTFTGIQQCAITAGTTYWVGFTWADPGTNNITWSRGTTSGVSRQNALNASSTFGTPGAALSGPIDAYVVVSTTVATDGNVDVSHPTAATYLNTGRTNGVEYTYTVTAVDAAGNESAPSDPATVTPGAPDLTAPSVPTGLAATAGDRQVVLTWSASTDADTGVRDYGLYRGGILVRYTTDLTLTDIELVNGQQYVYTVSARDNSLNESAQSGGVTSTPHAPAIGGVPFLTKELGRDAALGVEIAFGADLSADPSTWTWTDVTVDVRAAPGISCSLGRSDESSTSNPASLKLTLDNTGGDYSKGGRSTHYPYVRRGTPVRVRIDPDDDAGGRVVFHGEAIGWKPGWDSVSGTIPVVALTAAGTLRRLGQGAAPIQSPFRRAMEYLSTAVSYWPMEEGKASTYAPAQRGGGNMTIEGTPSWDADSSFLCSDGLPKLKDGRLTAFPAPYADTGYVQVRCLILLPESLTSVTSGAYLLSVFTNGTLARWDILYGPASLTLNRYNAGGALNSTDTIGFGIAGVPGRLSLELTQSGGNIAWSLGFTAADGASAGYFNGTITGKTVGTVSWIQFGATRNAGDTVVGHLTLENAITGLYSSTGPLKAFAGEFTTSGATNPIVSRMERLCSENSVPITRYSTGVASDPATQFDTVGPQTVSPLLTLLRECEAADQGQLWDGRSHGLSYTTRRRREIGTVALTIDAGAGELAAGFDPTDDDQRTRNKVAVKRTYGITSTYEDSTGPYGTATVGTYDESVTLNLGRDQDTIHHAQWQVGLGTADVEGYRYPSVTVDLRVSPDLAPDVLDIVPGDRIDVTNLDDTLDGFTAPTVSLIVEGIKHAITPKTWQATFQCSLFEPWAVGLVASPTGDTSDMLMRLDTDGSTLAVNAPLGATSISVATTGTGALWTTVADDFPFWIEVAGLPVRVTACSGSSSPQTFTCDPLTAVRLSDGAVQLWQPRRLGMGSST